MAKIKNTTAYPTVTPSASDLIIGTDVNDNNKTVTFLVGALGGGQAVNQDLNSVLGVGNTSLLNIELNGFASALGSSITVIDIFPTTISAGGLGSHGSTGQVLSSTGNGIAWIDSPGLNQSWNDTLAVSAIASANPSLTGTFTIQTSGGFNVLGTSTSNFEGLSYFFSTSAWSAGANIDLSATSLITIGGASGTAGQFLAINAAGTGLEWSSGGGLTTPTLQQVVTAGNTIFNSSIVLTGTGGISLAATNTISGQGVINLNGNATTVTSATEGRLIISQGSISLSGANSQILLGGNSGTVGQALVSNGPFVTPTWQNVSGVNETLQQVLDNGNSATQTINLTGAVNLLGTTGELNLGSSSFITLNTDRGTAGQVLISGGAVGFPSWATAGTGIVTSIKFEDSTYIDASVDSTVAAVPLLTSQLITDGGVSTGPGGLTQVFYDDDVTGTNYVVGTTLTTTDLTGNGSGIVVNIVTTNSGSITVGNLFFVSGGSGYADGSLIQINQIGSDNNCVIQIDGLATGAYYESVGRFSSPPGNDWDMTVSNVGTVLTITNSDGVRSSSFTLTGTGGAVFSNSNNDISLGFSGSGTGTVQSITLTDSAAAVSTAITGSGSFTFSEQAASATYLKTTSAVVGFGITLSTEIPTIQVVATVGATLTDTALTIQNSDATTNNSFVLGTTAVPSVASAGQVLAFNSTDGGYMEWVAQTGGGGMTSWTISDNAGTPVTTTVSDGETFTISGGTGISSSLNAGTRVLTLTNTGVTKLIGGSSGSGFEGDITLFPTGNITIGEGGVRVINPTITTAGTGYVAGRIYQTTVNAGSGAGSTIKVDTVNVSNEILTASIHTGGAGYTVSEILTLTGGGSGGNGQVTITTIAATGQIDVSVPNIETTYDLTVVQSTNDADITLSGANGTSDIVKLDAGTNITLTVSGNNVLIDAAAAAGLSSFSIITSPVSTTGTVN